MLLDHVPKIAWIPNLESHQNRLQAVLGFHTAIKKNSMNSKFGILSKSMFWVSFHTVQLGKVSDLIAVWKPRTACNRFWWDSKFGIHAIFGTWSSIRRYPSHCVKQIPQHCTGLGNFLHPKWCPWPRPEGHCSRNPFGSAGCLSM